MITEVLVVFEQDNKQIIQEGNIFYTRIFENGETFESADFNTLERAKASLGIGSTIEENNQLVAEFLGWRKSIGITYHKDNIVTTGKHFDFVQNKDWNGLMEVVEKIESRGVVVEIRENVCYIESAPNDYYSELESSKLQATYNACLKFIKWFNQQTK